MQQKIELAPFRLDLFEGGFKSALFADVERKQQIAIEIRRERLDPMLRFFIQVCGGDFRARRVERFRAAIGDGLIVGDAYYKAALAFKIEHESHVPIQKADLLAGYCFVSMKAKRTRCDKKH